MPSVRVWNSGGPPSTRLAAMVSPPLLLPESLLPLELLLPDAPHAVSAVSRMVAPAIATTILCLVILLFIDVSPEMGHGASSRRGGGPGRRAPRRDSEGSWGREVLGGLELGDRGLAAVAVDGGGTAKVEGAGGSAAAGGWVIVAAGVALGRGGGEIRGVARGETV